MRQPIDACMMVDVAGFVPSLDGNPNDAYTDATATPPSSPRYTVAASLPPSTRMAQRNATLDAFIALLPSNHQEEDVNDGEEEAMHSLVVTAGDGRRHYGFLRRVSEAAAAGTGGMQEVRTYIRTCMGGWINKM